MKCFECKHYYESYESLTCQIQSPKNWIHKFTCGMVRKKAQEKLLKTCPCSIQEYRIRTEVI